MVLDFSTATSKTLAAYLTAVRALMEEATAIRRSWIRQVGMLILDARTKPVEMVAPLVAHAGADNRELFAGFRTRLDTIYVPAGCGSCHEAFGAWLDKQSAACEALEEIGASGDLGQLRSVQRLLADGRVDTQQFSAAYGVLVRELRGRIEARRAARRAFRWPFRRLKATA